MKHATLNDYDEVYSIFQPYRKLWFPHLRTDKLKRQIDSGECILDRDVVITYTIYKKRTQITKGLSLYGEKGECVLHQIVSKKQDGSASKVFNDFFNFINTNLYLTVRSSNKRAIGFYKKMGMKEVGKTSWSNGTMEGLVFLKSTKGLEEFIK